MTITGIGRLFRGRALEWLPASGGRVEPALQGGKSRLGLALGALTLVVAGSAWAEGSGTMFPLGSMPGELGAPADAKRVTLQTTNNVYLTDAVTARTFLYVYAKAGETILIGRRGTPNQFTLYAPPSGQALPGNLGFGKPGNETLGGVTLSPDCSSATSFDNRTKELAGPYGTGGYIPCRYHVTTTGVYGVTFTAANSDYWDITVRSTSDYDQPTSPNLNGRVFTYAFAGDSGSASNRIYSTLYYVTTDGYRYRQTQRGLAPYQFVLYANDKGFLDQGEPLYHDLRGSDPSTPHALRNLHYDEFDGNSTSGKFPADGSQLAGQGPTHPIFFTDVTAADTEKDKNTVNVTLSEALGIPTEPPAPVVSDIGFSYPPTGAAPVSSNGTTYRGYGGVFSFHAQDVTSYRIFIKGDPDKFRSECSSFVDGPDALDNPCNRLIEGSAKPGLNEVVWDGMDNSRTNPVPPGTGYVFEVQGRNGEVHFPLLDAESNLSGGPTLERLNGEGAGTLDAFTVYYDDRGYITRGKYRVGKFDNGVPGHLCGNADATWDWTTSPGHAINGVNSNASSGGVYYRAWGAGKSGNTAADCASSNQYFGDVKGLDLWTYFTTDSPSELTFDVLDIPDVTTTVSAPAYVAPGGQVVNTITFANVGSKATLDGVSVSYRAQVAPGLVGGVDCAGATCSYNPVTGEVIITGLPTTLNANQTLPPITLSYVAPDSGGSLGISTSICSVTACEESAPAYAPNTASATTVIDGDANVVDVLAQVNPPAFAAPGSTVSVPVTFRNLGPAAAAGMQYRVELPPGTAGVGCVAPVSCSYNADMGVLTVDSLPAALGAGEQVTLTVQYTAPAMPGAVQVKAVVATSSDEDGATANNSATGQTIVTTSTDADVTVTVQVLGDANPGSTVDGKVVFENKGPATATLTQYEVELTADLADVSCVPGCTKDTSTPGKTILRWTPGSGGAPATLGNGGKFEPTFSYTAPTPTSAALEVSVTARVDTSTAGDNKSNNTAVAATRVPIPDVDMTVEVTVPNTPVTPGAQATGTVVCTNTGSVAATNATCIADEPDGVTNWSFTCTPPSSPSLAAGAAITCTYSFDTPSSNPPASIAVTGSTGADNEPDDKKDNNESTANVPLAASPDVYATIQMPGSANPGDQVTALLTFGNGGTSVAEGVNYKVTGLPQGLGSVDCGSTATCSYDSASQTVTITGLPGALAAGQKQEVALRWTVPESLSATTYTLTAEVTTTSDGNPTENDQNSATLTVQEEPLTTAEVTTTVQVPSGAEAGGPVNGTVKYLNIGSVDATGMVYKVTLSTGTPTVSYKGQTCTVGAEGVLSACNLPATLEPGESLELDLAYTAPAAGETLTVTTTVAAGNDTNLANNTASGTTQALAADAATPDVSTSVAPPATALPGATVEVPVTFENLGPATAENVVYMATLSEGLTEVSCLPAACTYDPGTGVVTVTSGELPATLPPGGRTTLTVTYRAPDSGSVKAKTRVDADDEPDAKQPNNEAEAETRIVVPGNLTLTKTVYEDTTPGKTDTGGSCGNPAIAKSELLIVEKNPTAHTLVWCFEVQNNGTEYLGAPVWDDPELPQGTEFIPVAGTTLPLAPGATGIWYAKSVHGSSVLNTAALSMSVTDSSGTPIPGAPPATGITTSTTTFGMIYDPPFGVKVGSANGTNTIRWTMVWVNDNVVPAHDVTVSDVIQAPMSYLNDGTLACVAEGDTEVKSCEYDAATNRVIAVADFGADFGRTVETARNRLFIAFNVSVPAAAGTVENQGEASWAPPGADPDEPLLTTRTTYVAGMNIAPVTPGGGVPTLTVPAGAGGHPADPDAAAPTLVELPAVAPVTAVPVDNPLALLLAALGLIGLMSRQARRIRR